MRLIGEILDEEISRMKEEKEMRANLRAVPEGEPVPSWDWSGPIGNENYRVVREGETKRWFVEREDTFGNKFWQTTERPEREAVEEALLGTVGGES